MAVKQRWIFFWAFVALVGAAILVAIVLTNMKHDTDEEEEVEYVSLRVLSPIALYYTS